MPQTLSRPKPIKATESAGRVRTPHKSDHHAAQRARAVLPGRRHDLQDDVQFPDDRHHAAQATELYGVNIRLTRTL